MYEVEVKVRAAHDEVRDALAERGADSAGAVTQVDVYFDAPHRDFAATDEALRLRTERSDGEERSLLTYKGPRVDETSKSRLEHETAVSEPADVRAALEALGFAPAATVRKRRERFRIGEYAVALDDVEDLGEFVEVETETDTDDIGRARDGAFEVLRGLGLDPDEQVRTSYLGLLLDASEA